MRNFVFHGTVSDRRDYRGLALSLSLSFFFFVFPFMGGRGPFFFSGKCLFILDYAWRLPY